MNANVNKVVYGDRVLIDLTSDTITPDDLRKGITAHDKSGSLIVGNAQINTGMPESYTEEIYDDSGTLSKIIFHGVSKIRNYCCYYATNLVDIEWPSNVNAIGTGAFWYCQKLKIKTIPSGITILDNCSFANCININVFDLPDSVDIINYRAFHSCVGLTSFTFRGTPSVINVDTFGNTKLLKTINVPWSEGEVAGAPWGATNAAINYNYTGE